MKKRAHHIGLKYKMILNILVVLVPAFAIISCLFFLTNYRMKENYMEMVTVNTRNIIEHIDELLVGYYSVSDTLALDDNLPPYMEKQYTASDRIVKEKDTLSIQRLIFNRYDLLLKKEKMSAILTYKGEVFNFEDIDYSGQEVKQGIARLDVMNEDKLAKFWWYPLRENFLLREPSEEYRNNKVIMGSRKVYSQFKGLYICSQIFAMKEDALYRIYKDFAEQMQGDVFIIMSDGSLLSTNSNEVMEAGVLPEDIRQMVLGRESRLFEWEYKNQRYSVCIEESEVSDWLAVVLIPVKNITRSVDRLYSSIIVILTLCMLACGGMVLKLYKSFMEPISLLNQSMKEVYQGNLNAYLDGAKEKEIGQMMRYYNSMLESINTHLKEKVEAERMKNHLELEVLMSQVNPHFLYNTLENIVWMSNDAGYPEIGRLAASLGRMYRLSLSGGQIIVRMQQEIEHLMSYIKIQQERYGDKVSFDLRQNIEAVRDLYTIKLILQPVVENSFIHGMGKLENAITIRVTISPGEEYVVIRVADNGVGMDKETLAKLRSQIKEGRKDSNYDQNHKSSGIGLHSVSARIHLYFGQENAVSIFSKKGMGTVTIIRLPRIESADIEAVSQTIENLKKC